MPYIIPDKRIKPIEELTKLIKENLRGYVGRPYTEEEKNKFKEDLLKNWSEFLEQQIPSGKVLKCYRRKDKVFLKIQFKPYYPLEIK